MPERWNKAAALRREQIESGLDITFNQVFVPYYLERVKALRPRKVLEVGCGTGHLSVRLIAACSYLEALEPSPGMHAIAKDILRNSPVELHNTAIEGFRSKHRFDLVVSHLCAQVVADIDAFCSACAATLAPHGRFLFSLPHPCFWNDYKEFFPRENYRYMEEQFASVTLRITKDPDRPITGIPYYHRPLGRYITALNKCGLALTDLDEIVPSKKIQNLYGEEWRFPRYCVLHATQTENPKPQK
jgi:SAM-dependent methyltransferase